jgi:hypothetical protein
MNCIRQERFSGASCFNDALRLRQDVAENVLEKKVFSSEKLHFEIFWKKF